MKGFIEVNTLIAQRKILININQIVRVNGNKTGSGIEINSLYEFDDIVQNVTFRVKETYEEVKQKIAEAVK